TRLIVCFQKRLAGFGPPGFRLGKPIRSGFVSGFQDDRKRAAQRRDLFPSLWHIGGGLVHAQSSRKVVGEALIVAPPYYFPRRNCHAEALSQDLVVSREKTYGFILGWK